MNKKLVYILTLGCPKNEADSRQMAEALVGEGFSLTKNSLDADFIIINSCTFTQAASEETIEKIFESSAIKKKNGAKLILAGCFAERYKKTITEELPEVDFHFGTGRYKDTAKLISENFSQEFSHQIESTLSSTNTFLEDSSHQYLKIAEGCDRSCSFCIIPKIRGPFKPGIKTNIIEEANSLWANGTTELGIVSQDNGNYKQMLTLLDELNELSENFPKEKWLRLYYLYPDKKSEKLISNFSKWKNLAPYLDMPLQHVSTPILKKMKRSGSYEYYLDLFKQFRSENNTGEIRTSFIIGFPEESPKDIDLILKFLEEARPEKLALFLFSPQEGTIAENYSIFPEKKQAQKNLNSIRDFHNEITKQTALERINKIFPVLIDGDNAKEYYGHRFQDAPEIEEITTIDKKFLKDAGGNNNKYFENKIPIKKGDIIQIKIIDYFEYTLLGEPS